MVGISPREMCDILEKDGWERKRQKGTHISYSKKGNKKIITIPDARKELSRPLATRLLKEIENTPINKENI